LVVSVGSVLRGAGSGLLLGTLAALACGAWVPSAIREMGSSFGASLVATVVAAVWVKGVPFALLGAGLTLFSGAQPTLRIASLATGLMVLETIISTPPWGVPWALLGHSQSVVPGVAQLAVVGGVPLVSAFTALGNGVVASGALTRWDWQSRRLGVVFLTAVAALAFLGIPAVEQVREGLGGPPLSFRVVQPDIPREERWVEHAQRTHLRAALEAASRPGLREGHLRKPLVILPEMLLTKPIERIPEALADLRAFAAREHAQVVVGIAREPRSVRMHRYRNSVLWLSADGSTLAEMDKEVAVPLVESGRVPGLLPELASMFGDGPRVEEGRGAGPLRGDGEFSVLLCYEALFSGLVTARRGDATEAILSLSDDSWALGGAASEQMLAAVAFRAIEQRLPFVRAALHGPSVVLNPYGRPLTSLPAGREGVLDVEVRRAVPPGWRERLALVLLLASSSGLGWLAASSLRRRFIVRRPATAALLATVALLSSSPPSRAEDVLATLTLDALSFVSFGNREVLAIPAGSTLRFRFGAASKDGSVPFTIAASDVALSSIPLPSQEGKVAYGLVGAASGVLRKGEDAQLVIEFEGTIAARLDEVEGGGTNTYPVRFTTEHVEAKASDGKTTLEVDGMRGVPGARYVQLVAGTTNKTNAAIEPGAAVYSVLSGTFDRLPEVP
jgi:apolipoprotein N-acyltransferase